MAPEAISKVLFALEIGSNDPRVSASTRKEAERALRNMRALARWNSCAARSSP